MKKDSSILLFNFLDKLSPSNREYVERFLEAHPESLQTALQVLEARAQGKQSSRSTRTISTKEKDLLNEIERLLLLA